MRKVKLSNQHNTESALPSIVDEDKKTVYLFGQIDDESALRFIANFRDLDKSSGEITVVLSSMGGEDNAGFAIYDTLLSSKNQVIIEGYGSVDSIAVLIFQGADKRLLAPQCRMLLHEGHVSFEGLDVTMQALSAIVQESEVKKLMQAKVIARRSKLSVNKVLDIMSRETYLSAQEAIKLNLADGIVGVR